MALWNKDYEHDPEFREHVLNGAWIALLIGYGITHSGLDILVVENVGDHFERAGILRLTDIDAATTLGTEMRKDVFVLG